MFKKDRDLAERSRSLLKNKETRKLRDDILAKLPRLTPEQMDAILGKEQFLRIYLASKTIVYAVNDVPYFVDVEGRGTTIVPTVQCTWRVPTVLRCFVIHPPVSSYVLNGADLMLPGLATDTDLDGLLKGEKMAVRVAGNPLPFAVGEALTSTEAILANGRKGRALGVWLVYGDCLCPAKGPGPNVGFTAAEIHALQGYVDGAAGEGSDDEEEEDGDEGGGVSYKGALKGVGGGGGGGGLPSADALDDGQPTPTNAEHADDAADDDAEAENDDAEEEATLAAARPSPADVDAQLAVALARAIKYVVRDRALPMLVSAFWAVVQRCGDPLPSPSPSPPPPSQSSSSAVALLDIRRSTHKKVSTFLRAMAAQGLVTLTESAAGVASVVAVQRTHDLLRGVKVAEPEAFRAAVETSLIPAPASTTATLAATSSAGPGGHGSGGSGGTGRLAVVELYRLPRDLREVLGGPRGQYGETLRGTEVRDTLATYFKTHNLEAAAAADADTVQAAAGAAAAGAAEGGRGDRSCVVVPPTDGLYALATSAAAAAAAAVKPPPPAAAASAVPPSLPLAHYDEYDDDVDGQGPIGGPGTVGGVWMPPVGGGGPWGTSSSAAGANAKPVAMGFAAAAGGGPALLTGVAGARGGGVSGGSAVGGWGVDKGTVWRPTMLPKPPAPAASAVSTAGSKADKAKKKAEEAAAAVPRTPVRVRKEDLLKALMRKLTPYHAIVAPNGQVTVTAGKVPTIAVKVEKRMGKKLVTILHGLEGLGIDPAAFAKDAQKRFACAASVNTAVGGHGGEKEVVVQGNMSVEAEAMLVDHCGVPRHLINAHLAPGIKAKK